MHGKKIVKIYCGVCESVGVEGEESLITTLTLDALNLDDLAATIMCKRCDHRASALVDQINELEEEVSDLENEINAQDNEDE
jgi:hypothetical protein